MLYVLSICQLSEQANIFVASIHPQTLVCPTSSKRLRFLADRVGDVLAIRFGGPRNKDQLNDETEANGGPDDGVRLFGIWLKILE